MEPDFLLIYADFLPSPNGSFPYFVMESHTVESEIRGYYTVIQYERQMFGDCW